MNVLFKHYRKLSILKFSQCLLLFFFYTNTILAQNSCSCPNGGVVLANIGQTNYSLQTLINTGVLPANQYSGCLVLDGNLDIDTNYTFWNLDANFTGSSTITVKSGNALFVRSGNYSGCNILWDGFIAEDHGTIRMSDVGVEGATAGLTLLDGSSFSLNDCYFDNNYRGIFVPPNPSGNTINRLNPITGNIFDASGFLLPGAASSFAYTGMELNNTSLLIAGFNLSNSNNLFRNAFNGIILNDSQLQIIGAKFRNIIEDTEGPFVPFSHNGIYSQNSFILSINNTYNDLGFGIKANNSSVANAEDTYKNMKVGVEIVASMDGFSSLVDSDYSNYTEHGIAMYNGRGAIGSNEFINLEVNDFYPTGITIWNSDLDSIGYNPMLLVAEQRGIDINFSNEIRVVNNTINFILSDFDPFPTVWSTGIRLFNAENHDLKYNYVSANGRIPSTSFDVQNSRSNNIECNTAQETVLGFSFFDNCVGTDFKGNVMRNNLDAGLVLNSNTIIGQQEANGNQWCNGSTASIINSSEVDSRFLVGPTGNSPQCQVLPPNNGTNWFIPINDIPSFTCGDDGEGGEGEFRSKIEEPEVKATKENLEILAADVQIYPNPSNGNITVSLTKEIQQGQIIIRDLLGRTVFSTPRQDHLTSQSIDLSHLNGIYFLSIKGAHTEELIEKIIIQ